MHSTATRNALKIGLQASCCTWLMYRIRVWYRILGRMLISNLRERTRHENRLIDIVYDIVGYNDPGFTISATERSVPLPKNILDAASARHRRASHEHDNGRIISRRAISWTLSSRYSSDDRNNSNHTPTSFTSPFVVTAHDFGIVEYYTVYCSKIPQYAGQFSSKMLVSRTRSFFARS